MFKILILLIFPFLAYSQNTIGLPEIFNYNKQSYNAGLQNWDIKQDKNGILYFANNEGLLSFDGTFWNLFPLPNKTIVRSVEVSSDNKIYVGGQDEFGYFIPGTNGSLTYRSLTGLIPDKDRTFGDVWDIVSYYNNIYFRTTYKLFKLTNESVTVYKAPTEWSYLGVANSKLYAHDFKEGLLIFRNNAWQPLAVNNILTLNEPVTGILSYQNDSILVTTLKSGLFILTNTGLTKPKLVNQSLFETERVYAATTINNNWIALATNSNGIYIIDIKGNIIQQFAKTEGLQNNNVLSVFFDQQSNLWLGLDNGVDFIAYNSAIKHITPASLNGSGYTCAIFENTLFAGTSNGLFSVFLQDEKDLSFSKGNFSLVGNTAGQSWSLSEINNALLLGHHDGAFIIKNNAAVPVNKETGFWNFTPLSAIFPATQIIAGTYRGLEMFNYTNGTFSAGKSIPNFDESSRFVTMDKNGDFWISHPYHGVFKISGKNFTVNSFTDKDGLPSTLNNHIYKIKNEIVVATEKGVYIYNVSTRKFEPSPYYLKLFGNQSLRYLKEDPSGNIWFIHEKTLGVADFSQQTPSIIYINEVKDKMLSGFEFINPYNQNNIFLGSEKGFLNINYEKYKALRPKLTLQIRTVRVLGKTDSLIFGGYLKNINDNPVQASSEVPEISYTWKGIRFGFSSPLFGYQSNLEYSFQLKGFDENWSAWVKRTDKDYTNLSAGSYRFMVKVRNNLGNESDSVSYSFKILPPWYQTKWATGSFLLLLGGIIYILYQRQKNKFRLQQLRYQEEQKKLTYIHDLEKSKTESELMNLQNDKLASEINFKNSELASSAMHLVKKGELLTKIKNDLTQLQKGIDNVFAKEEIKKMVKSLIDDDNLDHEWENFSKHFDTVHSDFLAAVKEKHADITSNEHKLCAYLRMNLSTKEIAQLMNISVRGVEISRYRLRKKFGISTETNLFDYLIEIHHS